MKKLKLIKGLAIALAASIFMTGTPVNASETLGDDWKPDSNDRYALALYSADKHFDSYENSKGERKDINIRYVNTKSYWQEVNRPQMSKKVINDCAINTGDGLLFGC